MSHKNMIVAFVLVFVFLGRFGLYAEVLISGKLVMKQVEFFLLDNQIIVKVESSEASYTLRLDEGWTGKISPQIEFTVTKNPNDGSLLKSILLKFKIEPTSSYSLEMNGVCSFTVDFQNPNVIAEMTILLAEGQDFISWPHYRMYESVGSNLVDQDFNVDVVQAISKDENVLPSGFALKQNYPNPFNSSTMICFDLPEASMTRISIFNGDGQLVEVLADGMYPQGVHSINWNASNYSSGTYYYRLETDDFQSVKKCILLK